MSKTKKYILISTSLFILSLGNGVCSEIYQKAMLDEPSRTQLARVFTDQMDQSKQASGVMVYPKEEFHMTISKACAPGILKNGLAQASDKAVQNAYKALNMGLKQTVERAQDALTDVPFQVTGVRIYGKKPARKFLVCEMQPDLSGLDNAKAAAVKACLPAGLHVSLARIDKADTGIGQQQASTMLKKAQERLQECNAVDLVTGKSNPLVLTVGQIRAENGRNQPLLTSKAVQKKRSL